ncbi:hypothetical protein STIAU_1354, partial [Stigmatella aurantiaca DW4/3-1]
MTTTISVSWVSVNN